MADTGTMSSLFTWDAIRRLHVDPYDLKPAIIAIYGVGGKELEGTVREICLKIMKKKTQSVSHEKV